MVQGKEGENSKKSVESLSLGTVGGVSSSRHLAFGTIFRVNKCYQIYVDRTVQALRLNEAFSAEIQKPHSSPFLFSVKITNKGTLSSEFKRGVWHCAHARDGLGKSAKFEIDSSKSQSFVVNVNTEMQLCVIGCLYERSQQFARILHIVSWTVYSRDIQYIQLISGFPPCFGLALT